MKWSRSFTCDADGSDRAHSQPISRVTTLNVVEAMQATWAYLASCTPSASTVLTHAFSFLSFSVLPTSSVLLLRSAVPPSSTSSDTCKKWGTLELTAGAFIVFAVGAFAGWTSNVPVTQWLLHRRQTALRRRYNPVWLLPSSSGAHSFTSVCSLFYGDTRRKAYLAGSVPVWLWWSRRAANPLVAAASVVTPGVAPPTSACASASVSASASAAAGQSSCEPPPPCIKRGRDSSRRQSTALTTAVASVNNDHFVNTCVITAAASATAAGLAVDPAQVQDWGNTLLRRVCRGSGVQDGWQQLPCLLLPSRTPSHSRKTHRTTPCRGQEACVGSVDGCSDVSAPPPPPQFVILQRQTFTVLYDSHARTPVISVYYATAEAAAQARRQPRIPLFFPDRAIPRRWRRSLSEMKAPGMDRGHLAPHASVASTTQAALEAALVSNTVLQDCGVNRGVWKRLERATREYVAAPRLSMCTPSLEDDDDNGTRGQRRPILRRSSAGIKQKAVPSTSSGAVRRRSRQLLRNTSAATVSTTTTTTPAASIMGHRTTPPLLERLMHDDVASSSPRVYAALYAPAVQRVLRQHARHLRKQHFLVTYLWRGQQRPRRQQQRGHNGDRADAPTKRTLAICTGPLFFSSPRSSSSSSKASAGNQHGSSKTATNGAQPDAVTSGVLIPDAMFLAAWDVETHQHVAFVVPNSSEGDVTPPTGCPDADAAWRTILRSFMVPLDELETRLAASLRELQRRRGYTVEVHEGGESAVVGVSGHVRKRLAATSSWFSSWLCPRRSSPASVSPSLSSSCNGDATSLLSHVVLFPVQQREWRRRTWWSRLLLRYTRISAEGGRKIHSCISSFSYYHIFKNSAKEINGEAAHSLRSPELYGSVDDISAADRKEVIAASTSPPVSTPPSGVRKVHEKVIAPPRQRRGRRPSRAVVLRRDGAIQSKEAQEGL